MPGKVDKPWCAYVGFTMPHPKFVAARKYAQLYPPVDMPLPKWPDGYLEQRHPAFQMLANFKNVQLPLPAHRIRRARGAYYGMITELDDLVGKVLEQLDRTGQRENTLIVYTSDHGEMLGEHGLWLKNTLLENAARVPLIVSGPGIPKGKTVEAPVSHVDLVATLIEVAGATPEGLRGQSLLPPANGRGSRYPPFAFSESHSEGNCTGSFMIRKDEWKYIYFTAGEPLLFNMASQAGEFQNLSHDKRFQDVREELHKHLTSVVEPDAVTFQAFRRQREILQQLTKTKSKTEFYEMLVGRLGSMQATMLLEQWYGPARA
jgi:choline-sulfatase